MTDSSVEKALALWQKEGLLSKQKADELRQCLGEGNAKGVKVGKGIIIFSTIGAVLVGLGIILFIGSHWGQMNAIARFLTLLLGYGVICASAHLCEKKELPVVAESLWFLSTISFGANIFLLGQIFHFTLTFWQGPFLWLLGTIAMGYARHRALYGYLAVPLLILTIGWFGGGSGWFFDDQFEFLAGRHGIVPVLPVMGIGLISTGLLLRSVKDFQNFSRGLLWWGIVLISVILVLSTVDQEVLFEMFEILYTGKQIAIMLGSILLTILAIFLGDLQNQESKISLAVFGLFLVFLPAIAAAIGEPGSPYYRRIIEPDYGLYNLCIFGLTILSAWIGVRSMNRGLVNAGIASASVIIIIQYFSWSIDMLDASLAFLLGGILLIILSVFMERTRRKLLSKMQT